MCGIIGYCGEENSVPVLLSGLHALEYRGYDSAGIAVFEEGDISTFKSKGRISAVEGLIDNTRPDLYSNCGIGHTRWATHGEPSDRNSHPHSAENVTLVHNGIIENYTEIKAFLEKEGYDFISETDTETAAKLLDYNYKRLGEKLPAIKKTVGMLRGSYAFGIMFRDEKDTVYALRKDSPLIVAAGAGGSFIASDIPAVIGRGRAESYYRPEEGEVAILERDGIRFCDLDGYPITKEKYSIDFDADAAEKAGYPHFMLKEIHEEPEMISKTVRLRVRDGLPFFDTELLSEASVENIGRIHIVACGTAMHAGLVGKSAIELFAGIPVSVEVASEFRYNEPILSEKDMLIAISQSGETADTLAALRMAKAKGIKTLSVVNVVGSSAARESDGVIYTAAGPEIAVASTKAYSVQLSVMYLLALRLALCRGKLSPEQARSYVRILAKEVPKAVIGVLNMKASIREAAKSLQNSDDVFFIGRGVDYPLAEEASLKLKEVSYIHSEAYPAGELKHGTISLITDGVPVVALASASGVYEKTVSNIKECKARGAYSVLICDEHFDAPGDIADTVIGIPHIEERFMPIPMACAFQLLAYYTAVFRGCDVDKPRNLAKSVTVE